MVEIKKFYAWIGPSNGYAAINWHADGPQKNDWVGLYADENKAWNEFLAWRWVSQPSPYVTRTVIANGLTVRYYTLVGGSTLDSPQESLDEGNAEGERVVTPISMVASISVNFKELMRTKSLNIEGEVNAEGESLLQPGCYVTCSPKGFAKLNWTAAKSQGSQDWVALYQDVNKSNDDYIPNTKQLAINKSSYVTSAAFVPGIHARYIKQGSPSIALRRSKSIAVGYFDLLNMYNYRLIESELIVIESRVAIDVITLDILLDQLRKAVKGELSVFSLGMHPYEDNLLFKNLSWEEVKVIGSMLCPTQYLNVFKVYYGTYKMAIEIADDDERNAKRHAFWQISMMQMFSESIAKAIGNAHEKGRPGTKEDNRVDELNNAAAIKYATTHPGVDPLTAANLMWSSGLLSKYNEEVAPQHTKDEF